MRYAMISGWLALALVTVLTAVQYGAGEDGARTVVLGVS